MSRHHKHCKLGPLLHPPQLGVGRVLPSHLSTAQGNPGYDSPQHADPVLLLWECMAESLPSGAHSGPRTPVPCPETHVPALPQPPTPSPPTIKGTFLPRSFSHEANANKKCLKWLTFPVTEGIREGWGSLSFKCIFIGKLISDLRQELGQLAPSLGGCREPEL